MSLKNKINFAFLTLIVIIFLIGSMTIVYLIQNKNNNEKIAETQEIVLAYDDVAFQTVRANAAIRGYMMFGESFMINNHYEIRETLHHSIDRLQVLGESGDDFNQFLTQLDEWETAIDEDILPLIEGNASTERIKSISNPILGEGSMRLVVFSKEMSDFHYDMITEEFDQLLSKNNQLIWMIGGFIIIGIIIAAVLALTFGRNLTRSITQVIDKLNEFSTGDFKVKLNLTSNDEFGELSRTFNHMTENLSQSMYEISDSSTQVAAMAEQFSASSEEVHGSTNEVTHSIINISDGTEEQAKKAELTHELSSDVLANIENILKSVTDMRERVEESDEDSQAGLKTVHQINDQMDIILNNSIVITNETTELNDQMNVITDSIQMIKDVADQTNLLALNASIEAARAGESGQGFAVVANEVRNLAETTNDISEKIESIIQTVSQQTQDHVHLIANNNAVVETGQQRAQASGEMFTQITYAVANMKERMNHMQQLVESVVKSISKLTSNIEQISNISEKTSDETQSIAATSEEQTAAMTEVADASNELAELAVHLQTIIQQYKY